MYKYKYENKQCERNHISDLDGIEADARKASGYHEEI